jgi:RNA polymerase sigma-54 factor
MMLKLPSGRRARWEGDGTTEMAPDDSEWGGDAPARKNNLGDDDEARRHRAGAQPGVAHDLPAPPGAGAAPVEVDRAALRFLIESLNDDGYLEDPSKSWPQGLAGRRPGAGRRAGAPLHRGAAPAAVAGTHRRGRAHLGECLTLQLKARLARRSRAMRSMPCRPRCASAHSPWSCWRGATSSAWRSCAATARPTCAPAPPSA